MSLFGSLMGDFEDDPIFGHHMRSMRQMNSIMGGLMPMNDVFGMMPFDPLMGAHRHSALTGVGQRSTGLMPFGFPSMPNMNRLLGGDFPDPSGASFCSSSFVSMTQGPDGRPQVYQATSSSKSGPGGIRETRKTVQDSRTGVKKMAIGHHIGERAHIVEREQNVRHGTEEERQDYINLEEEEAEEFDHEFTTRARSAGSLAIGGAPSTFRQQQPALPAIELPALPAPPSSTATATTTPTTTSTPILTPTPTPSTPRRAKRNKVSSRRPLRTPSSSPLALPSSNRTTTSSSSVHPHPYNASAARRNHRPKKIHHMPSNEN